MKLGRKEIALLILPISASAYLAATYLTSPAVDFSSWGGVEKSFSQSLYKDYVEIFSDRSSSYSFLSKEEIRKVANCEASIRASALKDGCTLAEAKELYSNVGNQNFMKRKIAQEDKCTRTLMNVAAYNQSEAGLRECVNKIVKVQEPKKSPTIAPIIKEGE